MTDFPMDTVIFNKIVEVFNQTRSYVLLLFPLAFFIRIAFGFILLRADSFIDILKDSLFLFLGLFFFTDILKMALQIPYFISSELSFGDWRRINLGEGLFTKALKRIVDWIGILSYWISFGLYVVIVSILGFFAGYILFFGTMFRSYGLLKVFFILLFTVSLWPLLWHSINFAVFTIAVSDNALANNVIIGGASLAKVFIPIWLMSKTSKIPVAETLKKVSFTGGSLAFAGGSLAYAGGSKTAHFLSNTNKNLSQNVQNKEEVTAEGAEINVHNTTFEKGQRTYISNEPENFALKVKEPVFLPEEKPFKENQLKQEKSLSLNKEENKSLEVRGENRIENNVSSETPIETNISGENSIENKHEVHIENNPQITKEIKETQNISQSHNESILNEHLTEQQSQNIESETTTKETTVQKNQQIFNEAIHREEWIEEGEEHIVPHRYQKEEDMEL